MEDANATTLGLRCKGCGAERALEARYACDECFGPLEVAYDRGRLAETVTRTSIAEGPASIWRYRDLLPAAPDDPARFPVGLTPLIPAPRLAEHLGLRHVWVKNDAANPTHSFKDRVVAVALAAARRLGFEVAACASTGNLANAVAAHSAALGMDSYVFIPADLERQKIVATGVHGGTVVAVDGTYDDVNRLCGELAAQLPWAFVNVNVRPYYCEGSKTLAYEVAEQLGWRLPDRCVAPIASGSLYTRIDRGYRDLIDIGLVDGPVPVLDGAQALGCSPVAAAFDAGRDWVAPVVPDTIAKSLAIGDPADGIFALETARTTGGAVVAVTEEEIVEGIALLAATTGLFTETAGGVTTAALVRLADGGAIDRDETVVLYITGDGLKTPDAVSDRIRPVRIASTVDAFESAFITAATA